jgi:multicomponent K+:H+ antiporter subunit G
MTTVAALLVLAGALLAFIGALGLVRLPTFFERVHPPTMGTTLGTGARAGRLDAYFSALDSHLVLHEILIGVFMTLTTPVTYILLGRAALRREHKDPET